MSSRPEPAPVMRWWGWGDPAHNGGLPEETFAALRAELGAPDRRTPPVPLEEVRVGDRELPSSVRSLLAEAVGEDWVREDRETRIAHAAGKGYPDLIRMRAGDGRSLMAVIGAGARGPAIEEALGASGYTLGHFPQSFEYSSAGGWVATRSAGQASTGYGTIEKLVTGLRLATPRGDVEAHSFPASAAGPELREMVVGSEGV